MVQGNKYYVHDSGKLLGVISFRGCVVGGWDLFNSDSVSSVRCWDLFSSDSVSSVGVSFSGVGVSFGSIESGVVNRGCVVIVAVQFVNADQTSAELRHGTFGSQTLQIEQAPDVGAVAEGLKRLDVQGQTFHCVF